MHAIFNGITRTERWFLPNSLATTKSVQFNFLTSFVIYLQVSSPRVEYIFSTLLNALGIGSYITTTDLSFYVACDKGKINYSSSRILESEVWIQSTNILFETEIIEQQLDCFEYNTLTAFFKTENGDFPFDLFAASFYLITRYEEYLPHKKDEYGRYSHQNSTAYRQNFLQLPLINLWLHEFRKLLHQKFPFSTFPSIPFKFLPTYDIDIAFSYLHKGLFRNLGGFAFAMWHSEWSRFKERMDVLFKKQKDPFESYQWLNDLHGRYGLKPIYFFLLASQNKDYDKNILPDRQAMKKLVLEHALHYELGIHPSWQSGGKHQLLQKEIETLQQLAGKKVSKSRQHYIRLHLPTTYRRLISAGIKEDYSMGYGSINGFRASYCLPYRWYDLQKEEVTSLIIYPFCYMDANSFYEQQYNSEEALTEMLQYANIIKQVGGTFITIWHNHFLGSDKMFTGWKEIYTTAIEMIQQDS